MSSEVITEICQNFTVHGSARLANYRLAFTRRSTISETGVADIVPESGMTVWGVLFEINDECRFELDKKEGFGKAYTRVLVNVYCKSVLHEAITYTVLNKESEEVPPSAEYMNKVIDGARNFDLPKYYLEFLISLTDESPINFRRGHLVKPTHTRTGAKGISIVKLPYSSKKLFKKNRFCIVTYKDKICAAKPIFDKEVQIGTCELDQTIRHSIDIIGRYAFGTSVGIFPSDEKIRRFFLLTPRTLTLPLHRPSISDSEKHISVLHENNIRLLGIDEGDYIEIKTVIKDESGKFYFGNVSKRVFSGSGVTLLRNNVDIPYPSPKEFYLDFDGRQELKIEKESIGNPMLLSPDVSKLFRKRLIFYGSALFLGLLAITPLFQEFAEFFSLPTEVGTFIGVFLSVFVAFLLTLLDLRGKIQY